MIVLRKVMGKSRSDLVRSQDFGHNYGIKGIGDGRMYEGQNRTTMHRD
jgi:hypothetical protein